jgi:hypothetical protein
MLGLGSDIMFAMMIWERKKEKKKMTVMEAYHYCAGEAGTVGLVGELSNPLDSMHAVLSMHYSY